MNRMKFTSLRVVTATSIFAVWLCSLAFAQEGHSGKTADIVWAQHFLRTLYPDLNGKKLVLSMESAAAYDEPATMLHWLTLYVGEGFKYSVIRHSGGCQYTITPPPVGWPQEWGPPPPPTLSPSPQDERCRQGLVYPKQFLTAGFRFDHAGRLINFGAEGSVINDNNADRKTVQALQANPQMTDAELFVVMKEAGIKYGPDDKEQFTRDLPLKKLEPFLGKLRIVSVTFSPLGEQRQLLGSWPNWTVEATATQPDGTDIKYILSFDHLKGDLTGLHLAQDENQSPGSNAKIK